MMTSNLTKLNIIYVSGIITDNGLKTYTFEKMSENTMEKVFNYISDKSYRFNIII